MTGCAHQRSQDIELYFYDELAPPDRSAVEKHLRSCAECRRMLDDLSLIRSALATRPRVDAPAGGDWTGFMRRLNEAVRFEERVTSDDTAAGEWPPPVVCVKPAPAGMKCTRRIWPWLRS